MGAYARTIRCDGASLRLAVPVRGEMGLRGPGPRYRDDSDVHEHAHGYRGVLEQLSSEDQRVNLLSGVGILLKLVRVLQAGHSSCRHALRRVLGFRADGLLGWLARRVTSSCHGNIVSDHDADVYGEFGDPGVICSPNWKSNWRYERSSGQAISKGDLLSGDGNRNHNVSNYLHFQVQHRWTLYSRRKSTRIGTKCNPHLLRWQLYRLYELRLPRLQPCSRHLNPRSLDSHCELLSSFSASGVPIRILQRAGHCRSLARRICRGGIPAARFDFRHYQDKLAESS